jgi:hypothetical protein
MVNHADRNADSAHAITFVGLENDDDEDERDHQRKTVRVGLVGDRPVTGTHGLIRGAK